MAKGKQALQEARARLIEYRLEVAQGLTDMISEPQLELLYKVHRAIEIVDAVIKETDVSRPAPLDDSLDVSG